MLRPTSQGFSSPQPASGQTASAPLTGSAPPAQASSQMPPGQTPPTPHAGLAPPAHASPPTALGVGAAFSPYPGAPATPGFSPYAGAAPSSPALVVPGLPPGTSTNPAVDLRGGLRVFVDKHRMVLIAGGLTALLVGALAARGCDEPARPASAPAGDGSANG